MSDKRVIKVNQGDEVEVSSEETLVETTTDVVNETETVNGVPLPPEDPIAEGIVAID